MPFGLDAILSGTDLKIFRGCEDLAGQEKQTKKARVELMADILSSDALFEGFCLSFYMSDAMLEMACDEIGCRQRYEALTKDPVYRHRRAYAQRIRDYAHAAVNLYGCVHMGELMALITGFEENRGELEQMGFDVVPDYGAREIEVFSMPDGIGGPVVAKKKKIYPNDLCPCGSGKN